MTSKQEVCYDSASPLCRFALGRPIIAANLRFIQGFIQSLAKDKGIDVDTASLDKGQFVLKHLSHSEGWN